MSHPNPHRATVPLDELLEKLTPEMVAEIRRRVPAGLGDQLDAAHRHSIALLEAAVNRPGRHVPSSSVDGWLRLGLLDTFLTWAAGDARTCLHAPDFRRPEPVWAAAWKPGLVVCTRCTRLLKVFGDADKTCDRCGRVTARRRPRRPDPHRERAARRTHLPGRRLPPLPARGHDPMTAVRRPTELCRHVTTNHHNHPHQR